MLEMTQGEFHVIKKNVIPSHLAMHTLVLFYKRMLLTRFLQHICTLKVCFL